MIAPCGINCSECDSYIGTITGDESLLEKMNTEYGTEQTDSIDFVCLGCTYHDLKLIATDCSKCRIRECVKNKNIDFCSTCSEYNTCDIIKPYRGNGEKPRDRMNALLRQKYYRK